MMKVAGQRKACRDPMIPDPAVLPAVLRVDCPPEVAEPLQTAARCALPTRP